MKKCPQCGVSQEEHNIECQNCGIVFEKFLARQRIISEEGVVYETRLIEEQRGSGELLFHVNSDEPHFYLYGRIALFLLFFILGWRVIFSTIESNFVGESFLHLINTPFHEAGHILFSPFGQFMKTLGGSLNQLLIPLICSIVFLIRTKDPFASAIALWWFGENFMDIAPYINDARALELPLLGGNTGGDSPYGFHDWEYILTETGWLQYDHLLAYFSYKLRTALMLVSFMWAGYLLAKQYKTSK